MQRVWSWHWRIRKDGKLGASHELAGPWYTALSQCSRCAVWGSPRKVAYRSDSYCEQLNVTDCRLCMACWNKLRPRIRRIRDLAALRTLANSIRRARPVES